MDKANAALADYLLDHGSTLHLVAHRVAPEFAANPRVNVHIVPRPAGSFAMAEFLIGWRGQAVAKAVTGNRGDVRVVVNGGNCIWPGVNWVHCVHDSWPCFDDGAPAWFKLKNRAVKLWSRQRERASIRTARVVVANSEKTRRELIDRVGVDPQRVHTVYLGSDSSWRPATLTERQQARTWLGQADRRPLVAFVGALSHDQNKGFDTLCTAWRRLCDLPEWDANLVVVGDGNAVGHWRRRIEQSRLTDRIKLLGFTDRVLDVLAAADLLVSPARYEAYGLNAHEAICRGVPALVSRGAGIAERYRSELKEMTLTDPNDVTELRARLLDWRSGIDRWREAFAPLGCALRTYTWACMAEQIVRAAECHSAHVN